MDRVFGPIEDAVFEIADRFIAESFQGPSVEKYNEVSVFEISLLHSRTRLLPLRCMNPFL